MRLIVSGMRAAAAGRSSLKRSEAGQVPPRESDNVESSALRSLKPFRPIVSRELSGLELRPFLGREMVRLMLDQMNAR